MDPEYIAYGLLNNDPLDDNSVESLTTAVEIWLDNSRLKQKELLDAIENAHINFSSVNLTISPKFTLPTE